MEVYTGYGDKGLPKRNHAVECYGFRVILIFGLCTLDDVE